MQCAIEYDLSKINEMPPIFALKVRNEITGDQAQKKANPIGGLAYLKANAMYPRSTALLTEVG